MSKHQTRSQRSASRARHAASIIRDVSGGMSWTIEVGYVDDDRQVAASNVVQAENLFPELIATLPVTREAVIAVARAGCLARTTSVVRMSRSAPTESRAPGGSERTLASGRLRTMAGRRRSGMRPMMRGPSLLGGLESTPSRGRARFTG